MSFLSAVGALSNLPSKRSRMPFVGRWISEAASGAGLQNGSPNTTPVSWARKAPRPKRIVDRELMRLRWKELKERLKSDPAKLAMAASLRRETTLTVRQIASRLRVG